MKLAIFTLALDAYRFLPYHWFTFNRLKLDWHWIVVEGTAANQGTTKWCRLQKPRLSNDGTTAFLKSLRGHPRVTVIQQEWWAGGKDQMCQTALDTIRQPCILFQVDADEIWRADQLEEVVRMFVDRPKATCARFDCLYMVGPNLRTVGEDCWGQNRREFLRAWRFEPGMTMTHEPPFLEGANGTGEVCMVNGLTHAHGLVFQHWAYVWEDQIAFKQEFYGYSAALEGLRRLQAYKGPFPTELKPFFPWVNGNPLVDRLHPFDVTHKG